MDAPTEKIKNMLKKKQKYKELYEKTMLADIIATEFKYHNCCREDVIRKDRETSIIGR